MAIERQALGWPLRAELTSLDNGITVLLTGGCRTHIGCVTAAEPGGSSARWIFLGIGRRRLRRSGRRHWQSSRAAVSVWYAGSIMTIWTVPA